MCLKELWDGVAGRPLSGSRPWVGKGKSVLPLFLSPLYHACPCQLDGALGLPASLSALHDWIPQRLKPYSNTKI